MHTIDLCHKSFVLSLFLFLSYTVSAQVVPDSELEVLREKFNKTVSAHEFEPKICVPIYQKLSPQFEKKQDWIYYYKSRIEIAWAQSYAGKNAIALQSIEATIADFYKRQPGNYYRKELGDAFKEKGTILLNADRFDESIAAYEKAFDIYSCLERGDADFESKEKYTAFCFNNLANVYISKRDFTKALDYAEKAIEIKIRVMGATHKSTLGTLRKKGSIYFELGFFNQALAIQKQVLAANEMENNPEGMANAYRKISQVYQRKKDFTTAEEYIRKSISIYDTLKSSNPNNKVYSMHQMGNVLKDGGRHAESIPWFEQSIAIKNKLSGSPNYDASLSTLNIGKAYSYLKEYEKSIEVYEQTWSMFDQLLDKKHPKYIELWLSMGSCYSSDNQIEKAHDLYQRAYELAKETTLEKSYERVMSCLNMATATSDLDKALMLCQEGLWEASTQFSYESIIENPEPEDFHTEFRALQLYKEKASVFQKRYQRDQNPEDLELALKTYQAASDLVDFSRQSFFTESAKHYLAKEARAVYEEGTAVAFELYKISPNNDFTEIAFQFMEKSRSLTLLEALQTNAASAIAKIPDSLVIQKQAFRNQLLKLETEFQSLTETDPKAQKLNDEIFAIKKQQQSFEAELSKSYPTISNIENQLEILSIGDIQSKLSDEETLLEFLTTDSALFVLKITKDRIDFFKHTPTIDLEATTIDFINSVNDNQLADKAGAGKTLFQKFTNQSTDLYQNIIATSLNGTEQKLIVIPDAYMNYLPFELLLTNTDFDKSIVNYADLPYLFAKHPIRYSFSANLQFQEFVPKKHNQEALAFAPTYETASKSMITAQSGFTSLSQTTKEVAAIMNLLNGSAKTGPTADEKSFKSLASDYGILHLAMHAYTDEENPMLSGLIFSNQKEKEDNILHAYELYGMQLNAQLAVLSACNTGSGKFEKGEGVMSLARGFRQAGVSNIVMSLWQADDESTRIIMEKFYQFLKDGSKIDEALRKAKLDFLRTNDKTFPHYWSAFVLMGNDAPIDFIQATNYWLWGAGGLLLFGGVLFLFKQRNG